MKKLCGLDFACLERDAERFCNCCQGLAQQHSAWNNRVTGKMPVGARHVRRELSLNNRHCLSRLHGAVLNNCDSARLGSLPVALRGSADTRCKGRGKNAASMRWRKPLSTASIVRPGATTSAISRVTASEVSSGMTNTPSTTPSMEFK